MGECPLCGQSTLLPNTRLIKDSCGHIKCRICLLKEEDGCNVCKRDESGSEHRIQAINHSLPIKLPENLNHLSSKIVLSISPSYNFFKSLSDEERLTISEVNDENENIDQNISLSNNVNNHTETVISENCDNLTITSNLLITVENDNAESEAQVETEKDNCNQIVKSPNDPNSYRSPEFNISDYLLFKNPYAQLNCCPSPEFRLSDYLVFKSPNRISDFDQPYKSPVQYFGNKSPNCTRSDYVLFSKKSPARNSAAVKECQNENTVCYMLNKYGDIVELSNFVVSEYLDDSSINKILMIDHNVPENQEISQINQNNNETEICEMQEIDEDKENACNLADNKTVQSNPDINTRTKDENKTVKNLRRRKRKEGCEISNKQNRGRKRKATDNSVKPVRKRRKKNQDWSHIVKVTDNSAGYKCTICQKVFKKVQSRVYHSACRLGVVPFKCTFENCDRTFTIRSHFEYHEKTHTGDKPFECDICHRKFIQKNKLLRHITCVHSRHEVECDNCGKICNSLVYLKIHMTTHKPNSYQCKFCPKIFTLDANRKRHELTRHSSDKPFQCDVCSSNFKMKFLLTRHKRIHENSRPFACKYCQQEFLSKTELKRHITSHSSEKLYSCKECEVDFKRKDNLKRHIKHHHFENQFDNLVVIKDNSADEYNLMSTKATDKLPGSKIESKYISRSDSIFGVRSSSKLPLLNHTDAWEQKKPVQNKLISIIEFPEISSKTKGIKLTDPIPLEDVREINRKIEESLQARDSSSFTDLSCGPKTPSRCYSSNSNSSDGTNFRNKQERSETGRASKKEKNDAQACETKTSNNTSHTHWRRRITESLKFQDY